MGRVWRQGRTVGERARAAAALLAMVAVPGLAACGNELKVVAPEPPAAPTSAVPAPGASVAGDTTTTTLPVATTSTTSTTVPTTTTTTVPPTTTSTTVALDPLEAAAAESVAFVNAKRAEASLPPLTVDAELAAMARAWAEQIAADQELRHNPDLSEQAPDRYTTVGENVGYAPSVSSMDEAWWESEGHRQNILRPSFQAVGIAFVVDGDGTYWGVQVFAGA